MKIIEHIISRSGGTQALSKLLDISQAGVRAWRQNGLPAKHRDALHDEYGFSYKLLREAGDPLAEFEAQDEGHILPEAA